MKNSATITASVHITDIANIKMKFHTLPNMGGTVLRIMCGYMTILTLFFEDDAAAKAFATETWVRWTDYDMGAMAEVGV